MAGTADTTLEDIIRLESYFLTGLKEATRIRKRLESVHPSASTSGLSAEQKVELIAERNKKILGKAKRK